VAKLTDVAELIRRSIPSIVDEVLRRVPMPQDGRDGAPGADGADGRDGAPGAVGRGIVHLDIREGNLHVLYDDGTDQLVGKIVGECGAAGKDADPSSVAALVMGMLGDFRKDLLDSVDTRIKSLETRVDAVGKMDQELTETVKRMLADD
jgi:hypothetical protein